MIVRFRKGGGGVDVVRGGKVEQEVKQNAVATVSQAKLPPHYKNVTLHPIYRPERIFYCDECRNYSNAIMKDLDHKNHKGHIFRPKPEFFDSHVGISHGITGKVEWVRKNSIHLPHSAAI